MIVAPAKESVPLNPFECAGIRRSLYLKNGIHTIALSNASYVRIPEYTAARGSLPD